MPKVQGVLVQALKHAGSKFSVEMSFEGEKEISVEEFGDALQVFGHTIRKMPELVEECDECKAGDIASRLVHVPQTKPN